MATIYVEKKMDRNLQKASKLMGVGKKELIDRAFVYYFESMRDLFNFEKELDAWSRLSDEAMREMSKSSLSRS